MRFIKIEHYLGNDEMSVNLCEKETEKYNEYFDKEIRDTFSKKFITEYFKFTGFHDWILQCVKQCYDGKRNTVFVTLYDVYTKQSKTIKYQNVQSFKCCFNENHFQDVRHDEYGIDEFYKISDKRFSHEVCCPSGSNYYIEFQKISIE